MSVPSEISRILNNIAAAYSAVATKGGTLPTTQDSSNLSAAVGSIPQSGGGVSVTPLSVTSNGTYTAPSGAAYSPVTVNVSGSSEEYNVHFVDFDGSEVATWGNSTVASKTALPANPTHTGLVPQGWNWTLAQIKDYISKYPDANLCIGQMYATASGLTEMDITLTPATGLDVTCNMVGNKTWGDGSSDSATTHTYADYGEYTITCDGDTLPAYVSSASIGGLFSSTTNTVNGYWCSAIRVGTNVTSFGSHTLDYCVNLRTITIPNSVKTFLSSQFCYCYSLRHLTIPNSVRTLTTMVQRCYLLEYISLPANLPTISTGFAYYCYNLKSLTVPSSITALGANFCAYCYNIEDVYIPDSVTSIANTFCQYDYAMRRLRMPKSVTSYGTMPGNLYCLETYAIPSGATVTYSFSSDYNLRSVTIPDSVTTISASAFSGCWSLTSLVMPPNLTTINATAFSMGHNTLDFSRATKIPSLTNVSALSSVKKNCKIYVPAALYEDWKTATNWSTYADMLYPI